MAFVSILDKSSKNSAYLITNSSGSFDFDTVTIEQHTSKLRVTENPVEGGANVADHAVLEPKEITINGIIVGYTPPTRSVSNLIGSNSLIDYALPIEVKVITAEAERQVKAIQSSFETVSQSANKVIADFLPDHSSPLLDSSSSDRITSAYEQLLSLQKSGEFLTLQTNTKQYKNMMIISITMNQQTYMTGEFSIVLREIFIVETQTTSDKSRRTTKQNLGWTQPKEVDSNSVLSYLKN